MIQTPTQAISKGREWVENNTDAYETLVEMARNQATKHPGSDVRISFLVEGIRALQKVSVPNAARAYLARRIEKELRNEGVNIRFTKAKSKIDLLMQ